MTERTRKSNACILIQRVAVAIELLRRDHKRWRLFITSWPTPIIHRWRYIWNTSKTHVRQNIYINICQHVINKLYMLYGDNFSHPIKYQNSFFSSKHLTKGVKIWQLNLYAEKLIRTDKNKRRRATENTCLTLISTKNLNCQSFPEKVSNIKYHIIFFKASGLYLLKGDKIWQLKLYAERF